MADDYAGDITSEEAWRILEAEEDAVLVDVRTHPEWNYVGLPDLSPLGKTVLRIEWQRYPDGQVNPRFVDQLETYGVERGHKVLLLCRSGARSRAAAKLLTAEGWTAAYNVADGFEGPHDDSHHRGTVAGWKHDGLPWVQG